MASQRLQGRKTAEGDKLPSAVAAQAETDYDSCEERKSETREGQTHRRNGANGERHYAASSFNFSEFINEYLTDLANDNADGEDKSDKAHEARIPAVTSTPSAILKNRGMGRQFETKKRLPECPVCHEKLDGKVKRVYTKSSTAGITFPFINTDAAKSSTEAGVKFCYPCYQHVTTQWREYNRLGVPVEEQTYTDTSGKRLSTADGRKQQISEGSSERWIAFSAKKRELAGTKYHDELQLLREEIDINDIKYEAATQKFSKQIENSTKKCLDEIRDEIHAMKLENDAVRRQVLRMRKELADTRVQLKKDITSLRKMIRDYANVH